MPRESSLEGPRRCSDRAAGRASPGHPGGARGDPTAALGVVALPAKKASSTGLPPVAGRSWRRKGGKHRAEKGCEEWGTPATPQCPSREPEQPRQGTQPPSGRAAAAAAVPRLLPVPAHPGAPGRPGRATQKLLPSRDRVAVAILTCLEQAHRREAAGDLLPLCGAAGEGHWGGQGFIWTAKGMTPSLPAGFPATDPESQHSAHRQGKENL